MSPQAIIFVVFIVLLSFSNVESVNDSPPPVYNAYSGPQQHVPEQSEEEKRVSVQQDLEKVLNYLNNCRKRVVSFRQQERPPLNEFEKQQRLKEQNELDELESNIREEINNLREIYERHLPLNGKYVQQINTFHKNVRDIVTIFERLELRRAQEVREEDQRRISTWKLAINIRCESEEKIFTQEAPAKDHNGQKVRIGEQEALKNFKKLLLENLQRLQDWHAMNKYINPEYTIIRQTVQQHFDNFMRIANQIDKRREQERLDEIKQVSNIKNELDVIRQTELEIRKKEAPASGMASVERKKEEFIEDKYDKVIRDQINKVEQRLADKLILDKEYAHLKYILNDMWKKFVIHRANVKQRREEEANIRTLEKLQLQKQQQYIGQGTQNTRNGQHININKNPFAI